MKCSYGLGGRGCRVSENGAGRSSSTGCCRVPREPSSPLSLSGPFSTSSLDTGLLVQAGQGGPVPFVPFGCAVRRGRALSSSCADCEGIPRRKGRGPTPGGGVATASEQTAFFFPSPALVAEDGGGVGCPPPPPSVTKIFCVTPYPTYQVFSKWAASFCFCILLGCTYQFSPAGK